MPSPLTSRQQPLSISLCGDVMTGRGIDQILPYPGDPALYETDVRDAREYVALAEDLNGSISIPVRLDYIWGDAISELQKTDVNIINLETGVTSQGEPWPDKGIHYRMHPENIGCLTTVPIHACSLANNHVLDWHYPGLIETLNVLKQARIACAGAGRDLDQASAPAIIEIPNKGRLLLFSFGLQSSGIPHEWRADAHQPGVNLLPDISERTAASVTAHMRKFQRSGDVIVASIHWGGNWDYEIPHPQIDFAHRLIDEGVSLIHGHSSHHVKGFELYNGHLILYGAGDFINDYEGIPGHEQYRRDLSLMYLVQINSGDSRRVGARFVPFKMQRFRPNHASREDAEWLCSLLNRRVIGHNVQVQLAEDNSLSFVS